MKPKAKTITVERRANIRHFTYRAHLSPKTGRLLKIVAGCRTWKTFLEAELHYQGLGHLDDSIKWSDGNTPLDYVEKWARRYEARFIIAKLENDVRDAQRNLRARLRNAKKRKVRR